MSKSNKARFGTSCKHWKDTVGSSRSQARARSRLKKATGNSPSKMRSYAPRQVVLAEKIGGEEDE